MVYSIFFNKAQFFQQAAPRNFLNLQEGARPPSSQKPENKSEHKQATVAESQTPEIIPDSFKALSIYNETTDEYEMPVENWGDLYFRFAGANRVLDCWPDHETYRRNPDTKVLEAAPYKKTPGNSELDKLGEASDIAYDFYITENTLPMAEWLRVFYRLSGGKSRMTWHQAKPLFADSSQLRKKMPPPVITVAGEVTQTGPGVLIMPEMPEANPSGPKKIRELVPGGPAGNNPAATFFKPTPIMQLERLEDNDPTPGGYAKLDRDNIEQEKEGIKKTHVVDQKEWLDGIRVVTPNPYDGIAAEKLEDFASYLTLSPEAKEKYFNTETHPNGLTLLELFEIYEIYRLRAGPKGAVSMNAQVPAYGILGIADTFNPKKLKERGIEFPLFEVPAAYEEKPKTDQ